MSSNPPGTAARWDLPDNAEIPCMDCHIGEPHVCPLLDPMTACDDPACDSKPHTHDWPEGLR